MSYLDSSASFSPLKTEGEGLAFGERGVEKEDLDFSRSPRKFLEKEHDNPVTEEKSKEFFAEKGARGGKEVVHKEPPSRSLKERVKPLIPKEQNGRGRFITFEGGEGVGKSTQARLLSRKLRQHHIEVILTREPGGTPFAETMRQALVHTDLDPVQELFVILAARHHHVEQVIKPALAKGVWVICDRFADSTRVYQGLALTPEQLESSEGVRHKGCKKGFCGKVFQELEPERQSRLTWIETWHQQAGILLQPDMTFVLEGSVEVSLSRRRKRKETCNKFDYAEEAFHHRLEKGFQILCQLYPQRCRLIQAQFSLMTVHHKIFHQVLNKFFITPRKRYGYKNRDNRTLYPVVKDKGPAHSHDGEGKEGVG